MSNVQWVHIQRGGDTARCTPDQLDIMKKAGWSVVGESTEAAPAPSGDPQ